VVGHPRITIIKEKRRYSILPLHFLPLFIEINLPSCTLLSLFSFLQLSYTSCPLFSCFSYIPYFLSTFYLFSYYLFSYCIPHFLYASHGYPSHPVCSSPLFFPADIPCFLTTSFPLFLHISHTSCPLLSHFSFIYSKLPVHFFPSFPTDISHPVNLLSYRPQFLSNSLPIHYRYPPLQIYHLPVFSSLSFPTDIYNFLPTSIPPFLQISLTSPPTFTPPFLQISLTSCPLLSLLSCRYL